jgi:hypothetical protein
MLHSFEFVYLLCGPYTSTPFRLLAQINMINIHSRRISIRLSQNSIWQDIHSTELIWNRLQQQFCAKTPAVDIRRVACSIAPAFTASKVGETQRSNPPLFRHPKWPSSGKPIMTTTSNVFQHQVSHHHPQKYPHRFCICVSFTEGRIRSGVHTYSFLLPKPNIPSPQQYLLQHPISF